MDPVTAEEGATGAAQVFAGSPKARSDRRIITTGRAGGLHKPPWGMSRAEPVGSSNRLPIADFPGMPLKGLILFAFFYRLTRKRVNVFFDTHLVIRIILL